MTLIFNNSLNINGGGSGGGGGDYTQGPGITIGENNEISVNYDSAQALSTNASTGALGVNVDGTTVVVDGSALKANINDATITITQGGVVKGTFTTNQALANTIALDGADLSNYYTKIQADNKFIDNSVVQTPLEYLPDTTQSINTQNMTNLAFSGRNGATGGGYDNFKNVYLYDSVSGTNLEVDSDSTNVVNLESLHWMEFTLQGGIDVKAPGGKTGSSYYYVDVYPLFFGYYENDVFNPVCQVRLNSPGYYNTWQMKTFLNGAISNTYNSNGAGSAHTYTRFKLDGDTVRAGNDNDLYTINVTAEELAEIKKITTVRVIPVHNGSYDPAELRADQTSVSFDGTTFPITNNGITLVGDLHPASLSLKYNSDFTVTNGELALTNPVDLTNYYNKSETDTLLGHKISTSAPDSPLTFQPYIAPNGNLTLNNAKQDPNNQYHYTPTSSTSSVVTDSYNISSGTMLSYMKVRYGINFTNTINTNNSAGNWYLIAGETYNYFPTLEVRPNGGSHNVRIKVPLSSGNSTVIYSDVNTFTPGEDYDVDCTYEDGTWTAKINGNVVGTYDASSISWGYNVGNKNVKFTLGNGYYLLNYLDTTNLNVRFNDTVIYGSGQVEKLSLKYNTDTLGVNGSNELYAKDTLPSQTGNSGKFLTTDGSVTSWATVSQPDMTQYYTKTQTDSLLDEKIDNDIVQYPLKYDSSISGTKLVGLDNNGSGNSNVITIDWDVYSSAPQNILSINNTIPTTVGQLENLFCQNGYVEIPFYKGTKSILSSPKNKYAYLYGHYNSGNWVTDGLIIPYIAPNYYNWVYIFSPEYLNTTSGFDSSEVIYRSQSGSYTNPISYNIYVNAIGFYTTDSYGSTNSVSNYQYESFLNATCVRRMAIGDGSLVSYTDKVVNTRVQSTSQSTLLTAYNDGEDAILFTGTPASLSLKYDSSTLGVNASNELTVPTATLSNKGLVKPDGSTITVDSNGVISAASGGSTLQADDYNIKLIGSNSDTITTNNNPGVIISTEAPANYTQQDFGTGDELDNTTHIFTKATSGSYLQYTGTSTSPTGNNEVKKNLYISCVGKLTQVNTDNEPESQWNNYESRPQVSRFVNHRYNGERNFVFGLQRYPVSGTATGANVVYEYNTLNDGNYSEQITRIVGNTVISLNTTHRFEVYHDITNNTVSLFIDGVLDRTVENTPTPQRMYITNGYYSGRPQIGSQFIGEIDLAYYDIVADGYRIEDVYSYTEDYSNTPTITPVNFGLAKYDPEYLCLNTQKQLRIRQDVIDKYKPIQYASGYSIVGEVSEGGM